MAVGPDILPEGKDAQDPGASRPLIDVVAVAILDCAAMRQGILWDLVMVEGRSHTPSE